jgi:hypothetical protein
MNFDFFYYFSWPGAGSRSRNFDIPTPAPAKSSGSLRLRLHNTGFQDHEMNLKTSWDSTFKKKSKMKTTIPALVFSKVDNNKRNDNKTKKNY